MPKIKTLRGASKRFRASKDNIKRGSAFRSHILTKKSAKRKRGLRESAYIGKADRSSVRAMLCI